MLRNQWGRDRDLGRQDTICQTSETILYTCIGYQQRVFRFSNTGLHLKICVIFLYPPFS